MTSGLPNDFVVGELLNGLSVEWGCRDGLYALEAKLPTRDKALQ